MTAFCSSFAVGRFAAIAAPAPANAATARPAANSCFLLTFIRHLVACAEVNQRELGAACESRRARLSAGSQLAPRNCGHDAARRVACSGRDRTGAAHGPRAVD